MPTRPNLFLYGLILTMVLLPCGMVARADKVMTALPYPGTITGYMDKKVTIKLNTGRSTRQHISKIRQIELTSNKAFTKAESLRKKNIPGALEAYAQAAQASQLSWLTLLIQDREYQLLASSDLIDKAVKAWLTQVDLAKASEASLANAPTGMGKKGSSANRSAIGSLQFRATRLSRDSKKNKALLAAVYTLLAKIQAANGDVSGASLTQAKRKALGGQAAPVAPVGPVGPVAPVGPKPVTSTKRPLGKATSLRYFLREFAAGKDPGQIAKKIEENLKAYEKRDQLPTALLLLGQCQMKVGGEAMLKKAGLNFILIFKLFEGEPEGSHALYLASEVNRALGQDQAARRALEMLIGRFGEFEDDPWVAKAKAKLGS